MRKFFNGFVIGLLFGAMGYWIGQSKLWQRLPAKKHFEAPVAMTHNSTGYFSDTFEARLGALDLLPGQIKEEMAHGGIVIRREAHDPQRPATGASDARAVAAIKSNYSLDPELSTWQIAVSCNQGHVALSGMVSGAGDIGRAIALALETDGVRDVTSTLQVKYNGLAGAGP